MKGLLFLLLVVQFNFSLAQESVSVDKCSEGQLETFWKQLDLGYWDVENDCHLEVKKTALIQISESDISTVNVPLLKYQRKLFICSISCHAMYACTRTTHALCVALGFYYSIFPTCN